ncbi:hypothetical protein K4E_18830 [Enterococcus thailandicus]|nr:hypothetical protein K4E_18830 [Enterococcus thailandicus]
MQLEYPLIEPTKKNIVLTQEKTAIAYYRIRSETVTLTDTEKKQKTKKKVARALKRLKQNGGFEIDLLPVNADIRGKMGAMRSLIDQENYAVGVDKLKKTSVVLENEMGMVYEYTWIIGVPLLKKDTAVELKESFTKAIDHVSEKVVKGVGFDIALDEDWEKSYHDQEQEVYQNLSELLVERLTEDELYYYQSYQFLKNISHERKDILSSQNLENLMATKIKPLFSGGLRFNCEYGESYVSYLPIGDMGVFLDGNHLLEITQKMPFPVEVKVQATFAESKGQLALSGRSSRARTRTKNIMQEAHLAGSKQKRKIVEGQLSLDDLDQKIDDNVDIIDWKTVIVVAGDTKKQMRARKKYLINRLGSLGIPLLKATFDNPYLFQSTLYGNFMRMKNTKWQHTSTVEALGELNFFTSLRAGTNLGNYFCRFDTTLEEKEDRNDILLNSKQYILIKCFFWKQQNYFIINKFIINHKITV